VLGPVSKKGIVELEKQGLFGSTKIDQSKFFEVSRERRLKLVLT